MTYGLKILRYISQYKNKTLLSLLNFTTSSRHYELFKMSCQPAYLGGNNPFTRMQNVFNIHSLNFNRCSSKIKISKNKLRLLILKMCSLALQKISRFS